MKYISHYTKGLLSDDKKTHLTKNQPLSIKSYIETWVKKEILGWMKMLHSYFRK